MRRLSEFLQGVKVVDLSRHLPGPLASMLMADMGANVIKVEPPSGDELRFLGPGSTNGNSIWFEAVNAGKTGITLDLKEDDGKSQLINLLETADVLLESFRPGVLDKLGFPIGWLRNRFPRLVICSLNGYGIESPLSDASGHDINYLAMNGLLAATGTAAQPVPPWPPIADCSAALFGQNAIVAALLARERDGHGCHIEVALADAPMPFMAFSLAELSLTGSNPSRERELLNGGSAQYRTYTTMDGKRIAFGGLEPKFWQNFCQAAERPEWLQRIQEPLPQHALMQDIEDLFSSMTLDECSQRFGEVDCCYAEVLELSEAVCTPHMRKKRLVIRGEDGLYQALFPAYVDGLPPSKRPPFTEELNK